MRRVTVLQRPLTSLVVSIGEILAPGLPANLWLNLDESRAKLIRTVRKIYGTPQVFMFFAIPTDGFVQRYSAKYNIDPKYNIAIGHEEWATIGMNRCEAMRLLAAYGDAIGIQSPVIPQKMLITMLIATLKKGSVTDPFAQKIMTAMRTELGMDIQIHPELIRDTARAYGNYMSSAVARSVVTNWKAWIPDTAMRLRLTVNQAVWEGLTGYNTVRKTVQSLPNFPWNELTKIPIYASEMQAARRAAEVVGNDEYYGFNRDLGVVGIRNYKNLTSACAAIQSKALGDEQIQRAQCFTVNYAYSDRVNQIINNFINNPTEGEELNIATREFIDAFNGAFNGFEDAEGDPNE